MDDNEWDIFTPSYRLPCISRRIAYGLGHILNDFGRTLWFNFLLIYFVAVIELEHSHVGYIIITGQLVGLIATFFFNYIGSRRNACCCWYTKRKSWHLCGTVLAIIATLLLFMRCIGCSHDVKWLQAIYYGSVTIAFQVGWSAIQSSHLGMIPEITRNLNERIELGAIRYSFGIVANMVVFAVLWLLFSLSSGAELGPKDDIWFRALAIITTSTGCITSIVFHLGTDEHGYDMFLDAHLSTSSFPVMTWRQWLRLPQFYLITIVYTCLRASVNLAIMYLPFYLFYTLQFEKVYIVSIPFAAYLGRVFVPYATRPLGSCTTPKVTLAIGSMMVIGVGVWAWFLKVSWSLFELQVAALAIILGAGGAIACISALDIVQRIFGDTGEKGSFMYGTLAALDKVMTGIAVVVVQVLYKQIQSNYENDGISYYRYVMVAIACFAGLALLFSLALIPMKFSILKDRDMIFSSASTSSQGESPDVSGIKAFEDTPPEDCFNYWACLRTSSETEAHYVAVAFSLSAPVRNHILPRVSGSANAIYSSYQSSVFEINRRTHSYESINALREASTLRSIQSAPNIIEYSGNHERHHMKFPAANSRPSEKDKAQLLDHEELPEPTISHKDITDDEAAVGPQVYRNVMVHPVPKLEDPNVLEENQDRYVACSPYDNVHLQSKLDDEGAEPN